MLYSNYLNAIWISGREVGLQKSRRRPRELTELKGSASNLFGKVVINNDANSRGYVFREINRGSKVQFCHLIFHSEITKVTFLMMLVFFVVFVNMQG